MSAHTKEQSPVTEIIITAAKGLAVGVILAAILLFAFSGIAYFTSDPDSLASVLGYAALYISAAAMGGVAARLSGDTGGTAVICAAVSGTMMLCLLILMSFLPAEATADPVSPLITVLMYAAVPGVSALSGMILRKKKVRKIKHKRRR